MPPPTLDGANRPGYGRPMRPVLAVFALVLATFTSPAWADVQAGTSDIWESACKKNLADEVNSAVTNVEVLCCDDEKPRREVPRLLAVKHALCIDEIVAIAEAKTWGRNAKYRQWFVAELKRMRELLHGDLDGVYRLAKYYRGRNDGFGRSLDIFLSRWALDHGHPPAEYDLAQGTGSPDGKVNEGRLRLLAERGYLPAILDMARRHLHGDGVAKNKGVAWYWLKKAQQETADTSSITTIPLERLLEDMDDKDRFNLAYLAHVHDDLDLSGIKLPSAFLPLTDKIPEPLTDREVKAFVEKFKGLKRRTDAKAYMAVEDELMARTAGLRYLGHVSIHGQIRPLGMGNDEFVRRKCSYHRALTRMFPQGRDADSARLQSKELALSSLSEKKFVQHVDDILQCGRIHPNAESRRMSEALAWAKKLDRKSPLALREIAARHLKKFGSSSLSSFETERRAADPEESYVLLRHYLLAKQILRFADYKELGR